MTTETLDPVITPKTSHGSGDHDLYAHIVNKAKVTDAYVLGTELEALCGKRWVPTRDPKNYPVCPSCREVAESMNREVPPE